jgi:hypothetical protein
MVLTVRRFNGGRCLVTYLREAETGQVAISTPVALWRKGPNVLRSVAWYRGPSTLHVS